MNRTDLFVAGACIFLFFAILAGITLKPRPAWSQEHRGHAEFHDVYKEWRTPSGYVPCCNAKYDHHNNLINGGDCYATVAEVRRDEDGSLTWWAKLDNGTWLKIDKRHIINELNPDETGTRAHICETVTTRGGDGGVLCFLPPTGGS